MLQGASVALALLCATALTLLAAPATSLADREGAQQRYIAGRDHAAGGRDAEALREFEKAVSEDPNHVEARYHLALFLSQNIDTYDRAEAMFLSIPEIATRAGSGNRNDLLFRSGLGLAKLYVRKGSYEEAIMLARNVISSAPAGVPTDDAYNALGLAYYYERLYEDAIFELRRAIKINPNNTEAHFNLKTIRTRLEHFQAGKIYSRMRDRREAIVQYRKAIELDPRFIEARLRLGMELLLDGAPLEALKELNRAESLASDYRRTFEIWYAQGLVLKALGRSDEALRKFEYTVRARPGFAAVHNEIGLILLDGGNADAAIESFAKAIGIDAKTDYVRNLQAAFARKVK